MRLTGALNLVFLLNGKRFLNMGTLFFLVVLFAGFFGEDGTEYLIFRESAIYDDVPEYENGWFGLFQADSVYVLRSVAFELRESTYVPDQWERPEPVYVNLPDEQDWPMLVIGSPVMKFQQGIVPTAYRSYTDLNLGDSIFLVAPGVQETRLFTTEYGLFISCGDVIQWVSRTRLSEVNNGNSIALCWAGDLDGDGEMDLILDDIDDSYYRLYWKLYLSSEAEQGLLVKCVASFYDVYY